MMNENQRNYGIAMQPQAQVCTEAPQDPSRIGQLEARMQHLEFSFDKVCQQLIEHLKL